MSREAAVKATAAALQSQGLDLTKFADARVANRIRSTPRVPTDIAAYALGFSVAELVIKGERIQGAPLAALLLRLKYAQQPTAATFASALRELLDKYTGGGTKRPDIRAAVARAALLEWLTDTCPDCRGADAGLMKARRCRECAGERSEEMLVVNGKRQWIRVSTKVGGRRESEPYLDPWGKPHLDREGEPIERTWTTTSPLMGCGKCGGLGRIFAEPKERRGVRCLKCRSSGRKSFGHRRRYRLVNVLFLAAAKQGGERHPKGLERTDFSSYWSSRYRYFLDILRSIDRHMGAGLDYGVRPSSRRDEKSEVRETVDADETVAQNAAIAPVPEEKQDGEPGRAHGDAVGQAPCKSPEEPTGDLPPKNS